MARAVLMEKAVGAEEALDLVLAGEAPEGMRVDGTLEIRDAAALEELPAGLTVRRLVLSGCPGLWLLPEGLRVRHLEIRDCPKLTTLPGGLHCYEVQAPGSSLASLPDDLRVEFRLDLRDSTRLTHLPDGLKVGTLVLRGCTSLVRLGEGLDVCFLDLQGCRQLKEWPGRITVRHGHLNLADCTGLTEIPAALTQVGQLDLRNCAGITALPERLSVRSWVDLAGSGVGALPASLKDVRLRWRGVAVDERVVFHPHTLTTAEILKEVNSEVRRVMLERVGFDWFLERVSAEVLDRDTDRGGDRRLLHLPLPNDEDLVCLSVSCPSTDRRYVLRVPPTMRTCREAAAWMAGFDNPNDYDPVVET